MTKDADAVLVDRETHPAPEISPRASCEMLPTSAVRSFPAEPDQQADQNDLQRRSCRGRSGALLLAEEDNAEDGDLREKPEHSAGRSGKEDRSPVPTSR